MDTFPPCHEDPELYFDPEGPQALVLHDLTTERSDEYKEAMSTYKREVSERRLKAQLTCLERCPMVELCKELGRDEEYGVWGGTLPEDRSAVRDGAAKTPREIRSKGGGTRIMLSRQLIGGATISQMEEMHGTKRDTIMDQLRQRVAELSVPMSGPSDNVQVA